MVFCELSACASILKAELMVNHQLGKEATPKFDLSNLLVFFRVALEK